MCCPFPFPFLIHSVKRQSQIGADSLGSYNLRISSNLGRGISSWHIICQAPIVYILVLTLYLFNFMWPPLFYQEVTSQWRATQYLWTLIYSFIYPYWHHCVDLIASALSTRLLECWTFLPELEGTMLPNMSISEGVRAGQISESYESVWTSYACPRVIWIEEAEQCKEKLKISWIG